MTSVVIYASHFGNTRIVAEAIASRLRNAGPVELFAVDDAPTELPKARTSSSWAVRSRPSA